MLARRQVTYTHGPGTDAPVSLWSTQHNATVVLHANRQGLIDMGTLTNGARLTSDEYSWAGLQSPRYPQYRMSNRGTGWLGSLVSNKQDASGLVYMRNRYMNPQTGQFTQQDPIGLAGGLNLYGYADGDPVNFSDPFGLNPCANMGPIIGAICDRAKDAVLGTLESVVDAANSALGFVGVRGFGEAATGIDSSTGDRLSTGDRVLRGGGDAAGFTPIGRLGRVARFDWSNAGHVFRAAEGHVNPTSAATRGRFARLFEGVANNEGNRNDAILTAAARRAGMQGYTLNFRGGQVWVMVRPDGRIRNAGVNALENAR